LTFSVISTHIDVKNHPVIQTKSEKQRSRLRTTVLLLGCTFPPRIELYTLPLNFCSACYTLRKFKVPFVLFLGNSMFTS